MGGLIVLPGSLFVLHVLKVDDPVDAVTVSQLEDVFTTGVYHSKKLVVWVLSACGQEG